MSSSYEEPKSWSVESAGECEAPDFAFARLKEEIASARRVLDRHRDKMSSIGAPHPEADDTEASA